MDMDLAKADVTQDNTQELERVGFETLRDFELALVGGGVGDIILG